MNQLSDHQKEILKEHVAILRACSDIFLAKQSIQIIQKEFLNDRSHHRLLEAKLYYYEVLLNAGKTDEASLGFEAIYARVNKKTRAFLECNALLGVCYLRQKKIEKAKTHIRFVIENTKNIKSGTRRTQFYQRLVKRIEEECLLSQLIGQNHGPLIVEEVHQKSIELVKKPESELFEEVAKALPGDAFRVVNEVSNYSIKLLPLSEQKLLSPPSSQLPQVEKGKKIIAALKRIGWKTFCDKSSNIFKLWDKGIPKVFDGKYFSIAIVTSLQEWKIGIPHLAAGMAATAMRFGCMEFCSQFRPEGLMIPKADKK